MLDFELPAQDARPLRLARELELGAVVLLLYRGASSPYCAAQLVELARLYDDFRTAGAEILGLSEDGVAASAALTELLSLPFPLLSEPSAALLAAFGAREADELGGRVRPTTIVLEPNGLEAYRFESRDEADRPVGADVLDAVRALALPPRELRSGLHPRVPPEPAPDVYRLDELATYLRGAAGAARALYERSGSEDAERVWRMAARYADTLEGRT